MLVTSLQFLHNLVTQNESRKLYLWLDLFCAPPNRILGTVDTSSLELVDSEGGTSGYNAPANEAEINNKFRLFYGPFTANFPPIDDDQFTELTLFTRWFAKNLAVALPNEVPLSLGGDVTAKLPDLSGFTDLLNFEMLKLSDMMTTVTIEQAIEEIRIAKRELIPALRHPVGTANLEESEPPSQHNIIELGSVEGDGIPDSQDEYDQSDDAGEDDLDDGDDELGSYVDDHQPRGSLTDIPLVLGPTEIEALPLIIQSAIFSARDITMMSNEQRLLQAVRCQLLLTQKPGHYLLRELLIFIAAWDLKETELYFKLMMHIMEAMMLHGLIPYAYRTFNEGKDIVSPAQAILLKILLQIFRSKRERGYPHHPSEEDTTIDALPSGMNPEIVLINFLLNTFRREVIPRTVALIWMQGQIRAGAISAASFPMNLWDMERVYEGVYQYIELFSFLNETAAWRSIIVDSNFTFELLTLIRVLEDNCPKIPVFQGKKPAVIATEDDMQAPNLDLPSHPEHPTADGRPSDSATPRGVNSNEPTSPSPAPSSPFVTNPSTSPPFVTNAANPMDDAGSATSEDASSFTWQNLKKLAVLALSSFAFNSPIVRTQVRELGGIELILACTAHDMANPFIREHAMLCVKFLLEGDEANQGIVKKLFEESSKVAKGVEMGADSSTAEGKAMDEKVWAKIASEQGLGGLSIRERKLSPEETEFLTGSHEGR